MSYIDAIHDREKDRIFVVERKDGQRVYRDYAPNYVFYWEDPRGRFRSVFDTPVSRFSTRSGKEFHKEIRMHGKDKLYESDINIVFRCLADNYRGIESPKLHVAFFDIEVDFDPVRGFSRPDDPFNPITAISVYLSWLNQMVTLAIPPRTITMQEAEKLTAHYDNCFLFDNEKDLLNTFLNLIDDADVLSGWNSEGYDIPYTVMRATRVLSKDDTRRFCLWNQLPKKRTYERFGTEGLTFDLVGRVHLDYMQLYRKFTYEERHSYSLDAIGEYEELGSKTPYEGTLDQLYNQDFGKFVEYNRQDTNLLYLLDRKLKYLDLANAWSHENTVLLATSLGTTAIVEQGIINEAHDRGMVVPNRRDREAVSDNEEESFEQAAGAYVAYPRKGMHEYIGTIDINSLYPSAIRALNMAPETIVGQLRPERTEAHIRSQMSEGKSFARAWEGLFASLEYSLVMEGNKTEEITIDWENGASSTHTGAEIWKMIFDSNRPWILSANGTIFTYEREGIIPGLLKKWYAERKRIQALLAKFENLTEGIFIGDLAVAVNRGAQGDLRTLDFDALASAIAEQDAARVSQLCDQHNLSVCDSRLYARNREELGLVIEYWDKIQLVRKISLNSLYGAILNRGCRFNDIRIGQSTTLTGRSIAKHMDAFANECITGVYDHVGDAIIYGDTDSCIFSAWPIIQMEVERGEVQWNRDIAIKVYDNIADQVNASFPTFMERAFHCPREMGSIIRGARELVASRGLFITKKRYAMLYYDKNGKRQDINGTSGKLKAMGLDLKRSDTPKVVQEFLSDVLKAVLHGADRSEIIKKILDFKLAFKERPAWEKGTPKRVNNLTNYGNLVAAGKKKVTVPGHVRAALNWNELRKIHGDNYSMKIVDGMKIIVCKLRSNPLGMTSVGYPTDELRLPMWFRELPFDDSLMETTIVDQKIQNLLGVLEWGLEAETMTSNTFNSLFEFE